MDSIEHLMTNLSIHDFNIGSWFWVHVTHIIDPNNFYVRPTSLDPYLPAIETPADCLYPPARTIGHAVVYKSKILKTYLRGQIVGIHNNTYDICAKDYGWIEKGVETEEIFKPLYNAPIPPLATLCTLTECYPLKGCKWSQDSIEAMKFYVGTEIAKLIVKCKTLQGLEVELVTPCQSEIGMMLALTGYSTLSCCSNCITKQTEPKIPKLSYKYTELSLGEEVHVRLQKATKTCEFYVAKIDGFSKYIKEKDELNQYAKNFNKPLSIHEAKLGLPVAIIECIYFMWERGVITGIYPEENKVDVRFVDWGHIENVDVSTLKPINSEMFINNPAIAIYCTTFEEKDIRLLHKIRLPGTELIITVKKKGNGFEEPYVVSLALK